MLAPLLALSSALLPQPPLVLSRPRPGEARRADVAALALRGGGGFAALATAYSSCLSASPVLTKSVTAGCIFGLSDAAAQRIEGGKDADAPRDLTRTLTSALVGLFYFGPALHYWLQMITTKVPGFGVRDTLVKTLLGQCFFGPTITCVFFAASLISTAGLASGLAQWPKKVRSDLLVTWASGLCFWPFVDLIVYSFVPVAWIPLGYNLASFLWTIWLSLQAAKRTD